MADESKLITIDPNGDTLIILANPRTKLSELVEETVATEEEDSTSENSFASEAADVATQDGTDSEEDGKVAEAPPVRFLVSSRQLRIVSPYFDNIFKGGYNETLPNSEDGLYHIKAEGWCPEAMEVIMNITHVRVKGIPDGVPLELFVKILVIVDYYNMQDTMALHFRHWLLFLKLARLPDSYCSEAVYWLFIAFQLKEHDIFKKMADIIVLNASGEIKTLDLPFAPAVQEELNFLRNSGIRKVYSGIQMLKDRLDAEETGCGYACDAMLLGTLHQGMRQQQLLPFLQEAGDHLFTGISLEVLWKRLGQIEDPLWYDVLDSKSHQCGLEVQFKSICFLSKLQTNVVLSEFGL